MSDFHLLLQEQIPQLMRYASALTRDAEQAADLVEDTVRDALDRQRDCRGDVRVWLLTMLHDLRGNPFREMTLGTVAAREPESLLTLSELDRALGQLPEDERAIILLIGLQQMSYANTAAILHMTVAATRSRLARARTNLRQLMGAEQAPRRASTTQTAQAAA